MNAPRVHVGGLRVLVVSVGLAMALVSALLVGGARSANRASGLIAFTRSDGIYVMRADGSGVRALWRVSASDVAWAPDGRTLAVAGSRAVWLMNADGGGRVPVASVVARSLTWSPDGRRIAFTRHRNGDNPDIWVMNADGSSMRRLARTPRLWESNVAWSPGGARIAFDSGGYVPQLYVVNANGSNMRRLGPERWFSAAEPDWSPDGRRIVFTRDPGLSWAGGKPSGSAEIYVMGASGRSLVRLTSTKFRILDFSPDWSPDGRQIAFVRTYWRRGSTSVAIYVMNADGSGKTRLTGGAGPAWQPVGSS